MAPDGSIPRACGKRTRTASWRSHAGLSEIDRTDPFRTVNRKVAVPLLRPVRQSQPGNHKLVSIGARSARSSTRKLSCPTHGFLKWICNKCCHFFSSLSRYLPSPSLLENACGGQGATKAVPLVVGPSLLENAWGGNHGCVHFPKLLQTFQIFHHIEILNISNDPYMEY